MDRARFLVAVGAPHDPRPGCPLTPLAPPSPSPPSRSRQGESSRAYHPVGEAGSIGTARGVGCRKAGPRAGQRARGLCGSPVRRARARVVCCASCNAPAGGAIYVYVSYIYIYIYIYIYSRLSRLSRLIG